MKRFFFFTAVLFGFAGYLSCAHLGENSRISNERAGILRQQGKAAFDRAGYAEAVDLWEQAMELYQSSGNADGKMDILILEGQAYQSMGQYADSLRVFQSAISLPEAAAEGNSHRRAAVYQGMGQSHQILGDREKAGECFAEALKIAEKGGRNRLRASIINDQANLLFDQENYADALATYKTSLSLADAAGAPDLMVKAGLNAARACFELRLFQEGIYLINQALTRGKTLAASHQAVLDNIALAKLAIHLHQADQSLTSDILAQLCGILTQCRDQAMQLKDPLAASHALGTLGEIYEKGGRYPEALAFTRQAVFEAQKRQSNEALLQWQWQTGRLLKKMKDLDGAVTAYQQAVAGLEAVRGDLFTHCKGRRLSFRDTVGPLYFEAADCLLLRSGRAKDAARKQADLKMARDVIEKLKTAELQDYYQDECVTYLQRNIVSLEDISPNTAVLYPVMLPDRTEMLLCLPDEIRQVTSPASALELTTLARMFRRAVEHPIGPDYKAVGLRLHRVLIAPIAEQLDQHRIDTLIFIPDGALRSIPISALYDGKQFLIEKYAVVTTPGLTLTDPHPLDRRAIVVLLAGITEPVQGFSGLPNVANEISGIERIFQGKVLKDRDFTAENMEKALAGLAYPVIHIASHGQFDKDPDQTFLLTYDGRLGMGGLETLMGLSRFRKDPVELLTLSACQTASGDDRAALGLAGVALKAGARGAIATLWFVDDEATSKIMTDLYQNLKNPALTKAEALQSAQIHMIHRQGAEHPVYWAPFLMIGNWL